MSKGDTFALGGGIGHQRDTLDCPKCCVHSTRGCQCGGIVHNDWDDDGFETFTVEMCDRCGERYPMSAVAAKDAARA